MYIHIEDDASASIGASRRNVTAFFAEQALLPDGWQRNVRIDARGRPHRAGRAGRGAAARRRAPRASLLPGMPNLHSHAFQRGMAGLAETRGPAADSFWTWREVMYRFALTHDAGRGRGGRRAALRRDAGGRLHARRRVPLSAPRPRRHALCRHRRDGRAHRRRGRRDRHRPDAAAGLLRAFRLRRRRARCTASAASSTISNGFARLLDESRRKAVARCSTARSSASRRTACAP